MSGPVTPVVMATLAGAVVGAAACAEVLGDDFTIADSGGMAGGPTTGGMGGSGAGVGAGAEGGGGGPGCGDGNIDSGEECDDGVDNGPGQSCLGSCVSNVCGDGDQGPAEGCDDGEDNAFALGACAPDCSRIIEVKFIRFSNAGSSGNFGATPVTLADSTCDAGYKAMFVFGDVRRATTIPNQVSGAIDWPVRPYTYYFNEDNEPVFLTDDVALIGIRGGQYIGIENIVDLSTGPIATNVSLNYLTLQTQNCVDWSSASSAGLTYGAPFETDAGFIDSSAFGIDCSTTFFFYCIEQ